MIPEFIDIDPSSLHVGIVTDLTRQARCYNNYYKHSAEHISGPATVHAEGTKSIMLYNNNNTSLVNIYSNDKNDHNNQPSRPLRTTIS